MTLTNLFSIVRQLSLADQLQLLRFLAEELAEHEGHELTITRVASQSSEETSSSLDSPQARSRRWQQWCDRYARSSVGLPDAAWSRDSIYSDRT